MNSKIIKLQHFQVIHVDNQNKTEGKQELLSHAFKPQNYTLQQGIKIYTRILVRISITSSLLHYVH